jgi:predicted nuclease with TOPRIM domain
VSEAVSEPELRFVIINTVIGDVATKEDIEKIRREDMAKIKEGIGRLEEKIEILRKEIYTQITELRESISKLEGAFKQLVDRISDPDKRIDVLDKRIDYVTKVSWILTGSVIATLIVQIIMRFLHIA